ncbi:MAG TPA: hypothetical protein VFX59_08540 [Polyangiales bacterium]|nr:hypothetical protein [Polyangiales bacterium]
MSHPWPELVEQLEAIALEAFFRDPDGLRAAMAQRHDIIAGLLAANPRELEDEQRSDLMERLARVHERDQLIFAALKTLRDQTQEELEKANTGMRAMNGYKSMVSAPPPPFRRIG